MMLDTDTSFPLYYQLKLHIESQVRSGAWQSGEHVPLEVKLEEKFYVLSTIVQQVLGRLAKLGSLTLVRGKETFIAQATCDFVSLT